MSDRLALSVGKIILAWGRLDQTLHLAIKGIEHALGEDFSIEGRFSERRKIFRRLCAHLSNNDKQFLSGFDRTSAQLVRLERKRGRIAHGMSGDMQSSALFLDFGEALLGRRDAEEIVTDGAFSFEALANLETEIQTCSDQLLRHALDALGLWKQAGGTIPQQ